MVATSFIPTQTATIFTKIFKNKLRFYQDLLQDALSQEEKDQLTKATILISQLNTPSTQKTSAIEELCKITRNLLHDLSVKDTRRTESESSLRDQLITDTKIFDLYSSFINQENATPIELTKLSLFIHSERVTDLIQSPVKNHLKKSTGILKQTIAYINENQAQYPTFFNDFQLTPPMSEQKIRKIFNIKHPLTDLDIYDIHQGVYNTNPLKRSAQGSLSGILNANLNDPNLPLIHFLFMSNISASTQNAFSQIETIFLPKPDASNIEAIISILSQRLEMVRTVILANISIEFPEINIKLNRIQPQADLMQEDIENLELDLRDILEKHLHPSQADSVPKPPHQDEITIKVSGVYYRASFEEYLNLEGNTTSWRETSSTPTKPFTEAHKKPDPLDTTKNIYKVKAKQPLKKATVIEYSERLNEYSLNDAGVKTLRKILIPMLRHAHQKSVNISEIENNKIQKIIYCEMRKAKIEVVGLHLSEKEQQKIERKLILDTNLNR